MDTFNTHVDFKHRAFIFASSLVKVAMAPLKTEYIERRPQWDCKLLILKPLVRQRKCRTTKQIEGNCCWTLSTKLICELFSASLQVKAQLMTFFPRLSLHLLACKSSSQHNQNTSQLKRIQLSFQELKHDILVFFFLCLLV